MYNKNNDYERNRKNENAIVYQTAEGKTITLTGADFESEADFLQWKKWSDNDYHDTERAETAGKGMKSPRIHTRSGIPLRMPLLFCPVMKNSSPSASSSITS